MSKVKCPNCGFEFERTKKGVKIRSKNENSYFHGVILPILSERTGYLQDEMKAVLKWEFKIKHTADLTTKEFEDFMMKIRRWASIKLGCFIPLPNEVFDEEI